MPEETIASAVSRTTFSFTLHANLFQLFQPIGGVSASPFAALLTTSCVVSASAGEERAAIAANQTNGPIAYFIHPPPTMVMSGLALALPNRDANCPRGDSCDICGASFLAA